ncbi:MAG: hypothetical protein K0R28_6421 [Paenibacillus sp.]|jgi:hypothetical protein|nr:hypothetical protein [Paenibacillus sp.]
MVRIRFGTIEIDSVSDSSSVNSGINIVIGRSSREETNEGMGSINGKDNRVEAGLHVIRTNRRPGGEEA